MDWMRQALNLAEQGKETCSPNPMVGCLIIKNNAIISQGFHKKSGGPHAEVEALARAGELAQGADVYVTLEPCAHFGKTPPCVDALITARVKRVHVAIPDPNPLVSGKGIEKLRRAGIEVIVGECQEDAYRLNIPFFHYITTKYPYMTAKWAMTLDGKIATSQGDSKWITSEASRSHAHLLRSEMCGIMIGANTLRYDDPLLTVRRESVQEVLQPRPIIVTASGKFRFDSAVFNSTRKVIVISSHKISSAALKELDARQITYCLLPLVDEQFSIHEILKFLSSLGLYKILVEGGGQLLTSFFEADCLNEIYAYIAPKIMGGCHSLVPIAGKDPLQMNQVSQLHSQKIIYLYPDVCVNGKTALTAGSYEEFLIKINAK